MSHQMLLQIQAAALLTVLTTMTHALFIMPVGRFLKRGWHDEELRFGPIGFLFVCLLSLWLIAAHGTASLAWAFAYLHLGVSETLGEAYYFALTTYTTLGFGDVLAPKEWQLLSGFASLNGLLMFGLSSAVLVDGVSRMWRPRG